MHFKVGDKVKCIDDTLDKVGPDNNQYFCRRISWFTQGKIYEVTKVIDDKWFRFVNDRGDECASSNDRFEKCKNASYFLLLGLQEGITD